MADPGYIRSYTKGSTNLDRSGAKLVVSILPTIDFNKGVNTTDLSLPSSTTRSIVPTSGLVEDYNVVVEIVDTGVNKASTFDNAGTETPVTSITVKDQVNFLLDTLIKSDIKSEYEVYIEWLGKTVVGFLTIRGNIKGDEFHSLVRFDASIKVGSNPFQNL